MLRRPDGMFIRKGRLSGRELPLGWLNIVPDIAWEVISPFDLADAFERRLADYRAAGIPLLWVIYPDTRMGRIHDGSGGRMVDEDGESDGGDILPGFKVRVGDILDDHAARIARLA